MRKFVLTVFCFEPDLSSLSPLSSFLFAPTESVLTCAALSVLLKECFGVMSQGASAFFERTHRMGISQFMAQYGGRNRIDETDQVLSVFMSLPSSRFAAPARSTCAMVGEFQASVLERGKRVAIDLPFQSTLTCLPASSSRLCHAYHGILRFKHSRLQATSPSIGFSYVKT